MNVACSLAWRLLLAVALVANPLVGMAGGPPAKAPTSAPVATDMPPCHDMDMADATPPSLLAADDSDQKAPCHDHGCPDSNCASACKMGACVGHCVFLVGAVALADWHGSAAQLATRLVQDARPPLLAPLIRPPIA